MKKTYTGTLMHPNDLAKAEVSLDLFERPKWDAWHKRETREFSGLTSWDIISGGPEADEVEADLPEEKRDELHEYLVLHFEGGESATFRNSHAALFIF